MRTRSRIAALVVAGLVLAGCGTESAPDASSEPDATDEPDATGEPDEDAMDDHDEDMAGEDMAGDDMAGEDMAGEGTVGEPADASEATRSVEVEAFDIAFDPESITLEAGEVVTFVVTNTGEAVHEFTLGDSAMQQEHAEEMAEMGSDMAHDEPYSVSLQPGETKELTWRFADGGTVEYACHEPGHYEAGMRGEISVG